MAPRVIRPNPKAAPADPFAELKQFLKDAPAVQEAPAPAEKKALTRPPPLTRQPPAAPAAPAKPEPPKPQPPKPQPAKPQPPPKPAAVAPKAKGPGFGLRGGACPVLPDLQNGGRQALGTQRQHLPPPTAGLNPIEPPEWRDPLQPKSETPQGRVERPPGGAAPF